MLEKKELRRKAIEFRDSLIFAEIKEKSEKIFQNFYLLPLYKEAKNIMTYVSIRKEINTHDFIKKALDDNKNIFIPKTNPSSKKIILSQLIDFDKDLERGHWGLLEPKKEALQPTSYEILDLIIVPGIAFSEKGYRIGYGGGYYDRFLSSLPKEVITLSLAFDSQIFESLPIESFDIPIDYILTESRLINCKLLRDKGYGLWDN